MTLAILAPPDLATAINEEHLAVDRAASSMVEHARQCGALLIQAKKQQRHGDWLPWLQAHCPNLPDRTARAYMQVEKNWSTLVAKRQHVADLSLRDALALLADKTPRVARNTGDCEWYTPAAILDTARTVLGGFDLDPASTPAANALVQADRFYTEADNGLDQPWAGRVWLNPPYASPLVRQFSEKLVASVRAETVTAAIVLINNCTDTLWFGALAQHATAVCFPVGRVRFWKPDRVTDTPPLQGQAIVYLGPDADRFCAAFAAVGSVWRGLG